MRTVVTAVVVTASVVLCALAQPLPEAKTSAPADGPASGKQASASSATTAATQKVMLKALHLPGTVEHISTTEVDHIGTYGSKGKTKTWETFTMCKPDADGVKEFVKKTTRVVEHYTCQEDEKSVEVDFDSDKPAAADEHPRAQVARLRMGIKLWARLSAGGEVLDARFQDVPKDAPQWFKDGCSDAAAKAGARSMFVDGLLPDSAVAKGDTYERKHEDQLPQGRMKTTMTCEVADIQPIDGGHLVTVRYTWSGVFKVSTTAPGGPRWVPGNSKGSGKFTFNTVMGRVVASEASSEESSTLFEKDDDHGQTYIDKEKWSHEARLARPAATLPATHPATAASPAD